MNQMRKRTTGASRWGFAATALMIFTTCMAMYAPAAAANNERPWYGRTNAVGIYHGNRLTLGGLFGTVPKLEDDETDAGATQSALGLALVFEGGWLGIPSQYGNFHGLEYQVGVRLNPNDFWGAVGFPVTFLNVGRGMPGSLRLGGSFGTGIGSTQAYLYVRGRAAMVIIPDLIDVEASVQWTPVATSAAWGNAPGNYEDLNLRGSMWYRMGRTKRAYEVYVEYYERDRRGFAPLADGANPRHNERDGEVKGFGLGVGLSLF